MGLEMISLKSPREIEAMRRAGRLTAQARALAGSMIRPGVTTHEIDTAVRRFIESHGAKPSFLGYGGFPGSACISVNEEVIHGIPGPRKLKEGDIVSVDVGAFIGGFHGDCAATYPCGQVSDEAKRLIQVTQQSFWEGMKFARQGCRVSDIEMCIRDRLITAPAPTRRKDGQQVGNHLILDTLPSVPGSAASLWKAR